MQLGETTSTKIRGPRCVMPKEGDLDLSIVPIDVVELIVESVSRSGFLRRVTGCTRLSQLTRLERLVITHCMLDELPSLAPLTSLYSLKLSSLYSLKLSRLRLQSLPELPSSLQFLFCYDNRITSLPVLPVGLLELNCSSNRNVSSPCPCLLDCIIWTAAAPT